MTYEEKRNLAIRHELKLIREAINRLEKILDDDDELSRKMRRVEMLRDMPRDKHPADMTMDELAERAGGMRVLRRQDECKHENATGVIYQNKCAQPVCPDCGLNWVF